jgi:hypothetical protein
MSLGNSGGQGCTLQESVPERNQCPEHASVVSDVFVNLPFFELQHHPVLQIKKLRHGERRQLLMVPHQPTAVRTDTDASVTAASTLRTPLLCFPVCREGEAGPGAQTQCWSPTATVSLVLSYRGESTPQTLFVLVALGLNSGPHTS